MISNSVLAIHIYLVVHTSRPQDKSRLSVQVPSTGYHRGTSNVPMNDQNNIFRQLPCPIILSIFTAGLMALSLTYLVDLHRQNTPSQCGSTMRPHAKRLLHPQRLAADSPKSPQKALLIGVAYLHARTGHCLALSLHKRDV
jgi:hypothetical protein